MGVAGLRRAVAGIAGDRRARRQRDGSRRGGGCARVDGADGDHEQGRVLGGRHAERRRLQRRGRRGLRARVEGCARDEERRAVRLSARRGAVYGHGRAAADPAERRRAGHGLLRRIPFRPLDGLRVAQLGKRRQDGLEHPSFLHRLQGRQQLLVSGGIAGGCADLPSEYVVCEPRRALYGVQHGHKPTVLGRTRLSERQGGGLDGRVCAGRLQAAGA